MKQPQQWRIILCLFLLTVFLFFSLVYAMTGELWPWKEWHTGWPPITSETVVHIYSGTDFLLPRYHIERIDKVTSSQTTCLYLTTPYAYKKLEQQTDLIGYVKIDSPEKALRYVRLFSGPHAGWFLRDWKWTEIVPASAVDSHYYFGQLDQASIKAHTEAKSIKQWSQIQTKSPDAYRAEGILLDSEWKAMELAPPQISKTNDGYTVTRWLIPLGGEYCTISLTFALWEQHITYDGKVTMRCLATKNLKAMTILPMIESTHWGVAIERY